jgi:hypothetical protein
LSVEKINIEKMNEKLKNNIDNLNSLKGYAIIAESLIYKVYDVFGRNTLLSILYQVGTAPGEQIAKRLRETYQMDEMSIEECMVILMNELKEFYVIQIRSVEKDDEKIRYIFENRCFLHESFKYRKKLKYGKAFCRVNKGYFEKAYSDLLKNKVKKVDINFLYHDEEKDVCVEEIVFYYK